MSFAMSVLTLGLIFSFLAMGILISFRIFAFADITTDGSLTLGAATATVLLLHGAEPILATVAGFLGGCVGGVLTAVLYTRCHISGFLAGILVIPMLYSISERLIGRQPVELPPNVRLLHTADIVQEAVSGSPAVPAVYTGDDDGESDLGLVVLLAVLVAGVVLVLSWFLRTQLGVAMRATGDNPVMVRGLGIDVGTMTILGLAIANGLAGLTGGLLVQYLGQIDLQIGVGMIVWGLASVMIGELLFPGKQPGRMLVRTVLGALIFRLLLNLVLLLSHVLGTGLQKSDLKLLTSLFVLAMLMIPELRQRLAKRQRINHA